MKPSFLQCLSLDFSSEINVKFYANTRDSNQSWMELYFLVTILCGCNQSRSVENTQSIIDNPRFRCIFAKFFKTFEYFGVFLEYFACTLNIQILHFLWEKRSFKAFELTINLCFL